MRKRNVRQHVSSAVNESNAAMAEKIKFERFTQSALTLRFFVSARRRLNETAERASAREQRSE